MEVYKKQTCGTQRLHWQTRGWCDAWKTHMPNKASLSGLIKHTCTTTSCIHLLCECVQFQSVAHMHTCTKQERTRNHQEISHGDVHAFVCTFLTENISNLCIIKWSWQCTVKIMRIKHWSHKFVLHEFLSCHTLQLMHKSSLVPSFFNVVCRNGLGMRLHKTLA